MSSIMGHAGGESMPSGDAGRGAPRGVVDLATLGAGFADLSRESQSVFRTALRALSHPGRPLALTSAVQAPMRGNAAAAVLLLALLDADSSLWLSPAIAAGDAGSWLRFHTGCTLVDDAAQAGFVWTTHAELPTLPALAMGSDAYPDQSATCIVDVPGFVSVADGIEVGAWVLRGPGIDGATRLHVNGLGPATAGLFLAQRAANHASFPRGVDTFLASPDSIVGLPRSTHVSET